MTGKQLSEWRIKRGLSLREVADLLGVSSPSTVKNWEEDGEITGPANKLLNWLIDGETPFEPSEGMSPALKAAMWRVEMTLEAWEKLDSLRLAGGFATVTDWIAALIQEELHDSNVSHDGLALAAESLHSPPVTEERRAVMYDKPKRGNKP